MPIDSLCKACGRKLRVDDSYAGQKARCPACGNIYDVPAIPTACPSFSNRSTKDSWENFEALQETQAYEASANPLGSLQQLQPLEPAKMEREEVETALPGTSADEGFDEQFLVKVPNGQVFGPADESTIREWAAQGRVNDTCDIRPAHIEVWMSYSTWVQQQSSRRRMQVVTVKPSKVENVFGSNLGDASRPLNQSPSMSSGQGVLILCLGVFSWLLCSTVVGAPVLAIITIIMANSELKKINEGRSPAQERTLVYIGLWAAIVNLIVGLLLFMLMVVFAAVSA